MSCTWPASRQLKSEPGASDNDTCGLLAEESYMPAAGALEKHPSVCSRQQEGPDSHLRYSGKEAATVHRGS